MLARKYSVHDTTGEATTRFGRTIDDARWCIRDMIDETA